MFEYTIEASGRVFLVSAFPIMEDASFDHEFGIERRTQVKDADIEYVYEAFHNEDGKEICQKEITPEAFKKCKPALEELIENLEEDYGYGNFQ